MQGEWIALDRDALNPSERVKIGNTEVDTKLSPYDVPTHLRSTIDAGTLHVEFRYLDEEPTREVTLEHGAVARIGRHSERLFTLTIPIPAGAVAEVMKLVIRGVTMNLPAPADQRHDSVIRSSRNVANQALEQNMVLF